MSLIRFDFVDNGEQGGAVRFTCWPLTFVSVSHTPADYHTSMRRAYALMIAAYFVLGCTIAAGLAAAATFAMLRIGV